MPYEQASQAPDFSKSEIAAIFTGLMLSMFIASLDQTIVATALSSIARDLNGWESLAWVVSAYLVTSTVTTPIYGRLSDLYGRRPILLISILIFVIASVLCALSATMPQLIAARALQGIGGGGLRAVPTSVVADIIPPRDRGRYQGYFSSVFAVSNALGPVLGGFFADYLSWHWIFWINLPLGFLAYALSNRHLAKLKTPARRSAIDWVGALLILASTTPILLGVGNAERHGGWISFDAIAPIAVGLLLLAALLLWEQMAAAPMLPLRLFRNPVYAVASAVTFLVSAVMVGLLILLPLDYHLAVGLSANESGIRVIPITLGSVIGSGGAGWLIGHTGRYRIFPILGTAGLMLGCFAIAEIGLGRSVVFDAAATSLIGLCLGCQFSPMVIAGQNALSLADTGIGMAVLMFFRLIGGAFGVALLSTILISSLGSGALAVPGHEALGPNPGLSLFHLDEPGNHLTPALLLALSDTVKHAFSHVFMVAGLITAAAFAISLGMKEVPLRER